MKTFSLCLVFVLVACGPPTVPRPTVPPLQPRLSDGGYVGRDGGACAAAPTCVPAVGTLAMSEAQARSSCSSGFCLPTVDDGGVCVPAQFDLLTLEDGGRALGNLSARCNGCGECNFDCSGFAGFQCPTNCTTTSSDDPTCGADCGGTCRLP